MAALHFRLSNKSSEKDYHQIYMEIKNERTTSCGKTAIYIHKDFFDKHRGIDEISLNKKRTHRAHADGVIALKKFNSLRAYVEEKIAGKPIDRKLLQGVIDAYYGVITAEEIKEEIKNAKPSLQDLFERYLTAKKFQHNVAKGFRTLLRAIQRFEGFTRATLNPDYVFDIDTITRDDLESLRSYLEKEDKYAAKYPTLFKQLLTDFYVSKVFSRNTILGRGENTRIKMMSSLKAVVHWLIEQGITKNNPFIGFKMGMQIYGTPAYITIEERNQIANAKLPTKHLRTQRDVFIFHCLIGCRVSDLITLTADNIIEDNGEMVLQYVPIKTKNDKTDENCVRVPLHGAMAYIEKYKGVDAQGRLMPFISPQKYNDTLKEIFKKAGITRPVPIRDPRTGATVYKPICDIASSHMARRTFVGNLYFKVQDPNMIGEMSGHSYGSRAFQRYRKVETSTLSDAIKLLEE